MSFNFDLKAIAEKKNNSGMLQSILDNETSLTEGQKERFNSIVTEIDKVVKEGGQWDNVVSLVGAAGVGKTYMTVRIIKALLGLGYKCTMTTPTHKALRVVKDMMGKEDIDIEMSTIHSFLNLKLKPNLESGLQELIAETFNKNTKRCEVLLVDESSMVSEELYNHISDAIRYRRAKCVFFIGDKYQLPPVDGATNPVFTQNAQHELTEIVRQAKGNPIISLATDIRERIEKSDYIDLDTLVSKYECPEIVIYRDGKDFMTDFFTGEPWYEKDQVIASYTNENVDKYNRAVRKKYWADKGENVEELPYLMVGDTLIFQDAHIVDDTVIHANNDIVTVMECERIFDPNIECWYWHCVDEDSDTFAVIDPLSKQNYENKLKLISTAANQAKGFDKKKYWEMYYMLKGQFQSVKYSFASTVHKLQGSTFEHCYIDMREMKRFYEFQEKSFIYRLMYVAVTRASKDIRILI